MTALAKPPMTIVLSGTSLSSAGRLATPDHPWPLHMVDWMRGRPACKGQVVLWNAAKGSAQSVWGVTQASIYAPMKPTHMLREDFAVNDCVAVGGGEQNTGAIIPTEDSDANFETEIAAYRASNPAIKIAHLTMSSVSDTQTLRTSMEDWITAGKAKAAALDIPIVDNYAGWPKPLDVALTNEADGLHPLWTGAFELYSWPNIATLLDSWMEDYWA